MKKKICLLLLALVCLLALAGCGCEHVWEEANCNAPKTCVECGETEGEPIAHSWIEANCDTAKTCEYCGQTDGAPLGHSWLVADCVTSKTCEVCGTTDGEPLGHTWTEATVTDPKTCQVCGETEGEPLDPNAGFTESEIYQSIVDIVEEAMASNNPTFEYVAEDKILYIHLESPAGTTEALLYSTDELTGTWEELSTSLCDMSSSIYDVLAASGYDINCSIMLHSDANPENVFLATLNGLVIYDVMDEL